MRKWLFELKTTRDSDEPESQLTKVQSGLKIFDDGQDLRVGSIDFAAQTNSIESGVIAGEIRPIAEFEKKHGAGSENRTRTPFRIPDFESGASTSSAIPACVCLIRGALRSSATATREPGASIDKGRRKNYRPRVGSANANTVLALC